jgi:hypothetical protein
MALTTDVIVIKLFLFVWIYKLASLAIRHIAINNMCKGKTHTLAFCPDISDKEKKLYQIDPVVNGIKLFPFVKDL